MRTLLMLVPCRALLYFLVLWIGSGALPRTAAGSVPIRTCRSWNLLPLAAPVSTVVRRETAPNTDGFR